MSDLAREQTETSIKRLSVSDRDWTKGSIVGNLLSISWPMILSGSLMMLGPTVDLIWVGKLGDDAVAGVGIAGMVVILAQSLVMGLFIGLQAIIARSVGAGDNKAAVHVARQGIIIGTTFSIIVAVIGAYYADDILSMVGASPAVVQYGGSYLKIQLTGAITLSLQWMTNSTMVASGDTMRPLWISATFRAFHIALSPFLVFGWWVFPRMGVDGAALTNVLAQGLGAGIGFWFLFSGRTRLRLSLIGLRLDFRKMWQMIKIGIPASITTMDRTLINFVVIVLVTGFGTLSVAAHTIGQRIDMFILVPAISFGQATGVLAAQNLGADQPQRAVRTAWIAVGVYSILMVLIVVVLWFWAEYVTGIFSNESELVALSSVYIRIQILSYLLFSLVMVLSQCLSIVGDTIIVMVFNLLTSWGVILPLAIFLPKITNLGVSGIWWAMVFGLAVRAVMFVVYFLMGKWVKRRI